MQNKKKKLFLAIHHSQTDPTAPESCDRNMEVDIQMFLPGGAGGDYRALLRYDDRAAALPAAGKSQHT